MKDTKRKKWAELSLKNHQRKIKIDCMKVKELLKKNNRYFTAPPSFIDIVLVSNKKIKELNRHFLNKNSITDVLSFRISKNEGEIIISAETAEENAKRYGMKTEDEILYLIIHGYLHLRNYTDYTLKERKKMFKIQDRIFNRILNR